ncbi:MAG: lipid-A-disaccharide synthase [Woeseiaceae bacterium]
MLRVGLVAGEISGDALGAGLMASIQRQFPDAVFEGVGGPAMRAAGMECWHDADELAVMGLTEVIRHLPRLLKLRRGLIRRWQQSPPDVFVGIDAPDFNLGLEIKLRKREIPTVHYVSPSVWAWREGRVKKIARACNRVLCLLPFEPAFYAKHDVDADFVGHPLATSLSPITDTSVEKAALGLSSDARVLVIMPGSRMGEIQRLGRDFVDAAVRIQAKIPDLQIVAPLANQKGANAFQEIVAEAGVADKTRISVGDAQSCMRAADVILMASGTATLEALLHARPMVVAYRLAPSTHKIVTSLGLIKVDRFSLPNLLTSERLVDEFIQDEVTPTALADAVTSLLTDHARQEKMQSAFAKVHEQLRCDSNELAARAVLDVAGKTV